MSRSTILITGGTGLVGLALTQNLLDRGYQVKWLSRSKKKTYPDVKVYRWDIAQKYIEDDALDHVDFVVHLAGAGVADKRWTTEQKRNIRNSRVLSTQLLYDTLQSTEHSIKKIVCASAIGLYGTNTRDQIIDEKHTIGNDFLAQVVQDWEQECDKFITQNIEVTKLRIGVVLSKDGGAFTKLTLPIKFGVGAGLGTGAQYLSWIHIEDLCNILAYAIQTDTVRGAYNAVSPNPVTNIEVTQKIAKTLKKPLFLPNIPEFVLKLGMGEMSTIITGGSRVSSKKIQDAGFQFKYDTIEKALLNLL